jgi:hypothetical protein
MVKRPEGSRIPRSLPRDDLLNARRLSSESRFSCGSLERVAGPLTYNPSWRGTIFGRRGCGARNALRLASDLAHA